VYIRTLRARLVLLYSALVTFTVTLVVFGGFYLMQRRTLAQMDASLQKQFAMIEVLLKDFSPPYHQHQVAEALGDYVQRHAPQLYLQINTDTEWLLYRSPNLGNTFLPDLTSGLAGGKGQYVNMGTIRVGEYYLNHLHVQAALPLDDFLALQRQSRSGVFWGIPSVFVTSLVVGFLISGYSLRPLRAMQSTARHISVSNLSQRIPIPRGHGELRDLAKLLNEMFDRLEHSFHQIQRFTADTAHELKTPLAIIRLHAERLLHEPDVGAEAKTEIEDQLQEIHRLDDVIERLLVLAKAEAKTLPLHRKRQSVKHFVQDFADDAKLLAEEHNIHFALQQCDAGEASFDATWMRQVLLNALHNSLKFSPEHSAIHLTSALSADAWCVEIADEGPGIPPDHLPHIFDRFVQVDPQSQLRSGSGIGLAICKSIVELHGGHIHCRNRKEGHGLTVSFTLPRQWTP
jgi:heavy metal sensor kinase